MQAKTYPSDLTFAVAVLFSKHLRDGLADDDVTAINERNAAETDARICHSHDFCDANMVMHQALVDLELADGFDPDIEADRVLWNGAWEIAIRERFFVDDPDNVLVLRGDAEWQEFVDANAPEATFTDDDKARAMSRDGLAIGGGAAAFVVVRFIPDGESDQ